MNKLKYLFILLALLPVTLWAQEMLTCKQTRKEYLFLGSLSVEWQKGKFIENGKICWKDMDSLQQTDFLSTKAFLDIFFSQNLQFEMEGYEPFWKARLTNDLLIFFDPETGKETAYPMRIVPNTSTVDSHIYFMFEGKQGHIFGLVDYAGLRDSTGQEYCEYNLEEDEKALYRMFFTVGNKMYKGCVPLLMKKQMENSFGKNKS